MLYLNICYLVFHRRKNILKEKRLANDFWVSYPFYKTVISSIWSSNSCNDARVLQSLWDAEILACHITQLSTSTFHIFMNEERQWMLGCCDWLQRTHSTIRPPNTHIHTHTLRARRRHAMLPQCIKGIRLPLTHAGEIERKSEWGGLALHSDFLLFLPRCSWSPVM